MSTALATPVSPFRERAGEPFFGETLSPSSEALLQARIKDLQLHVAGTPLERMIEALYAELEAKGISLRPQCYLSDQWGCPNGVPVIGIPFYLADPALQELEEKISGGLEGEHEIMMYLRHEAGHAFNYAYRLYEGEEWLKVFGDYSRPYDEAYKPQPFSRKYVAHISGWYAQKHPDEDFAETFAVWLTPDSNWRVRYKRWGALKKLEYMERVIETVGRTDPVVTLAERDLDVDEMEETVLDHYRVRLIEQKIEISIGDHLDEDLTNLFEAAGTGDTAADTLVRAERQQLSASVAQYSGVGENVLTSVIDHLLERVSELGLTVFRDRPYEYITRLTALLTALAMNYLYTDRFFEVE